MYERVACKLKTEMDIYHMDNFMLEQNLIKWFRDIYQKYGIDICESPTMFHNYTIRTSIMNDDCSHSDIIKARDVFVGLCKSLGLVVYDEAGLTELEELVGVLNV